MASSLPQVTDAITTTDTTVIGNSPGVALSMLYQAESQAFALGMQNAVSAQQQMTSIGSAVTALALFKISKEMT